MLSSSKTSYPPRLIEDGKVPKKEHSMNHNCGLAKFGKIKEDLGDDVFEKLKESSVGVFVKLAELEYIWAAGRVHYFLSNQLAVNNDNEMWCLIGGRPIPFSHKRRLCGA